MKRRRMASLCGSAILLWKRNIMHSSSSFSFISSAWGLGGGPPPRLVAGGNTASLLLQQQRRRYVPSSTSRVRHASSTSIKRHDEFFRSAAASGGSSGGSPSLDNGNHRDTILPILSSDLLAKIEAFGRCLINNNGKSDDVGANDNNVAAPSLSIRDFLLSVTAGYAERGHDAATSTTTDSDADTGTIPLPVVIIDVRTPSEYERGHIPNAINIPLFTNEERVVVGTLYKQRGQEVAIRRGLELVSPRMTLLASQLLSFSQQHQQQQQPNIPMYIYCHRGGMRSASVAWLAHEILHIPNVRTLGGGYKCYRRHILDLFDDDDDDDNSKQQQQQTSTTTTTTTTTYTWPQLHLLGGRTGCGKTDILLALRDNNNNIHKKKKKGDGSRSVAVVDLEGLANHRGSSYGSVGLTNIQQPTVEQFENNLAATLLPMLLNNNNNSSNVKQIWLENENVMIGQCRIPAGLWDRMKNAPMVTIHRTFEERVSYLVSIYVNNNTDDGYNINGREHATTTTTNTTTTTTTTTSVGKLLSDATRRISKRLGPQRTTLALEAIEAGNWDVACRHILDYYDRTYDKDISTRTTVVDVDVSGLSAAEAANVLIDQGLVIPSSWGDRNETTAT